MTISECKIEGSLTGKAHDLVRGAVELGDTVVDATVGNGHDTLFLAHCVRTGGNVVGFDIQEKAVAATRQRLMRDGVPEDIFNLHSTGHEQMSLHVPSGVSVVMFNLGYLPGSDKSTITLTRTTLKALGQAVDCLKPQGLLSVMCYPGHSGGDSESDAVTNWFKDSRDLFGSVTRYRRDGARPSSPFLLMAEKAHQI